MNKRERLEKIACELLQVHPSDLYFTFVARSRNGWYLEYQNPRYPGDRGEHLGIKFEDVQLKLKQLIGEPC